MIEVDFDRYSFTKKNQSIVGQTNDQDSVFAKNNVFVPPRGDLIQISLDYEKP